MDIMVKIDSLFYELNIGNSNEYGKFIYYYARAITGRFIFEEILSFVEEPIIQISHLILISKAIIVSAVQF